MTTDTGKVYVLPPDAPFAPESIPYDYNGQGYTVSLGCRAAVPIDSVPGGRDLSPLPNVRFWCTRSPHGDDSPHCCTLHDVSHGGAIKAHIIWDAE